MSTKISSGSDEIGDGGSGGCFFCALIGEDMSGFMHNRRKLRENPKSVIVLRKENIHTIEWTFFLFFVFKEERKWSFRSDRSSCVFISIEKRRLEHFGEIIF